MGDGTHAHAGHQVRGRYGSTLFVNPLMALYFTFDLDVLAERNLYLEGLEQTVLIRQTFSAIEQFRYELLMDTARETFARHGFVPALDQ